MNDDMISRQAAIDSIMGEPTEAYYPVWFAKKIELLPSAKPQWIPCSERLPENNGQYLICTNNEIIHVTGFTFGTFNGQYKNCVTAWMPLPKPYVESQIKGKWIRLSSDKWFMSEHHVYRCNQCKKYSVGATAFCPHCGIKMENYSEE